MKPTFIMFMVLLLLTVSASAAETETRTGFFTTAIQKAPAYANAFSMLRRMEHGLVFRATVLEAKESHDDLNRFTVNPANETWAVIAPENPKDVPLGVLVWIPGNDDADVPDSIRAAADKQGMVVIAARNSGEDQPYLERRSALALIGVDWVSKHFPVDKQRIMVGGAGEAAEVALRLAVGYADIFSGALLVDGGAQLGSEKLAIPVRPLPAFIRQRSDIVFVNAGKGPDVQEAYESFAQFCAGGARLLTVPGGTSINETASNALSIMSDSTSFPVDKTCVARYQATRDAEMARLDEAFANGRWREAPEMLVDVHIRYGGLVEKQVFDYSKLMAEQYRENYYNAVNFMLDTARTRVRFFGKPARITGAPMPLMQ